MGGRGGGRGMLGWSRSVRAREGGGSVRLGREL